MKPDQTAQKRWVEQWTSAGVALARQRRRELREMTAERALAASEALLDVVRWVPLSAARRTHSGLVEQQELLHRRVRR